MTVAGIGEKGIRTNRKKWSDYRRILELARFINILDGRHERKRNVKADSKVLGIGEQIPVGMMWRTGDKTPG